MKTLSKQCYLTDPLRFYVLTTVGRVSAVTDSKVDNKRFGIFNYLGLKYDGGGEPGDLGP